MIRILALSLLAVGLLPDEEPWTATLVVKTMHCDECVGQLDAQLKSIQGVKSVEKDAAKLSIKVSLDEKKQVRARTFQAAVPADMKLERLEIVRRGRVVASKPKGASFAALGSGQVYELGGDQLDELVKALGAEGRGEFRLTGDVTVKDDKELLSVTAFEKKDWKD